MSHAGRYLLKVHLVIDCLHKRLQDLSQLDLRHKLLDMVQWQLLIFNHLRKVMFLYLNENLHLASMHLHLHEL